MGKFKLYRNFNGSFRGETITVPDDMDLMVLRSGAGERVKEFTKDKNKMIVPKYKKRNVRSKKNIDG